jgi:hypothetical protein
MPKPPKKPDKLPKRQAESRFNQLEGNLARTPHKDSGKIPSAKAL